MGPSTMSFLSFRVIFHFHDCGRKGSLPTCHFAAVIYSSVFKEGTSFKQSSLPCFSLSALFIESCSSAREFWATVHCFVGVHGEQHAYDLGLPNGFEWCMYKEISDVCTTKERTYMHIYLNVNIDNTWTHNWSSYVCILYKYVDMQSVVNANAIKYAQCFTNTRHKHIKWTTTATTTTITTSSSSSSSSKSNSNSNNDNNNDNNNTNNNTNNNRNNNNKNRNSINIISYVLSLIYVRLCCI